MPRVPTSQFCKASGGIEGENNTGVFLSSSIFLGLSIRTKKPWSRKDILTQRNVTIQISLLAVACEWHEEREENKYFVFDDSIVFR